VGLGLVTVKSLFSHLRTNVDSLDIPTLTGGPIDVFNLESPHSFFHFRHIFIRHLAIVDGVIFIGNYRKIFIFT
jgi:hypothetical protein